MKKLFIYAFILICGIIPSFAQPELEGCSYYNQNCPTNTYPDSTSYILLEVNDNPELYCWVKICYCYSCYVAMPTHENMFYFNISFIYYRDNDCMNSTNINWNVFKISIIKALALSNPGCYIFDCNDPKHQNDNLENIEMITAQCYENYWCYPNGRLAPGEGMMLRCGDGYCAQRYHICYDNGTLKVTKLGVPFSFGDCSGPIVYPSECIDGDILDPCYSVCY